MTKENFSRGLRVGEPSGRCCCEWRRSQRIGRIAARYRSCRSGVSRGNVAKVVGVALKYVTGRAEQGMTGVDVSIFSSSNIIEVFDPSGYVDGRATEVTTPIMLSVFYHKLRRS